MDVEPSQQLLLRATVAYSRVVGDAEGFRSEAVALVAEARRARADEALVLALRAYAWAERARLGHVHAKALLDEAVRVARRHGLDERLGEALVTRAAVNHELGRLNAAQHDLDRAAQLLHGTRSAELELQQAALHQNIGRLPEAAVAYHRVLATPGVPADVRAKVGNNLALVEIQRGHVDAALRHIDEACAVSREVGPALVALVAQTRGWVLMQAGMLTESLRQFDEAGALYEAAGMPLGEHYVEYADALMDLRLVPEATAVARRAAAQYETTGVRLMGAEAQLRVARLALLAGEHADAAAAAAVAVDGFRRQRRTAWSARATLIGIEAHAATGEVSRADLTAARRAAATLERLALKSSAADADLVTGLAAAALGNTRIATRSLDRAHELARRAPVLVRLKGRVAAATAAGLRGQRVTVLRHSRAGLRDLAEHRGAFASMELRARASGHGVELGRLGLEVLLRTGRATRVLEWMEQTRAAALLAVETPTTAGIEEEFAALRAVHAELADARRAGDEPSDLLARQAAIEHGIRRATWRRETGNATASRPSLTPLAELRTLLDGQVLVEYGALGDRLFAVVLERRRTWLVELGSLGAVLDEIRALVFALRRLTRPSPSPAAVAAATVSADVGLRRLTELLIQPLGIASGTGLVVVPLGVLQRVPWSALHDAPVSLAPSASFFARTRRAAAPDGETVLVAGPQLEGAIAEIDALRSLHDHPTVLVPPDSTVDLVAKSLSGASFAHLACHGIARADNPTFSSLLLSDGSLTVHELDQRGIAPHRVVIAACDSAAEVSYDGNETLGFVSAAHGTGHRRIGGERRARTGRRRGAADVRVARARVARRVARRSAARGASDDRPRRSPRPRERMRVQRVRGGLTR